MFVGSSRPSPAVQLAKHNPLPSDFDDLRPALSAARLLYSYDVPRLLARLGVTSTCSVPTPGQSRPNGTGSRLTCGDAGRPWSTLVTDGLRPTAWRRPDLGLIPSVGACDPCQLPCVRRRSSRVRRPAPTVAYGVGVGVGVTAPITPPKKTIIVKMTIGTTNR